MLRDFFFSKTQLCSAESLNLWSQNDKFSKNQKEVLQSTCYQNTLANSYYSWTSLYLIGFKVKEWNSIEVR